MADCPNLPAGSAAAAVVDALAVVAAVVAAAVADAVDAEVESLLKLMRPPLQPRQFQLLCRKLCNLPRCRRGV